MQTDLSVPTQVGGWKVSVENNGGCACGQRARAVAHAAMTAEAPGAGQKEGDLEPLEQPQRQL